MEVVNDEYFTLLNRRQSDIEGIADIGDSHINGIVSHLSNLQRVLRTFLKHLAGRTGNRIGSQAVSRFSSIAA